MRSTMLYINARFLTQKITGVQRFALELSKEIIKQINDVIFIVPNMDDVLHLECLNNFNIIEVKGGSGHFWEQVTLPLYMLKNKGTLINLCNTAPIFYSNQVVTHHDITYIRFPDSFSFLFRAFYRLVGELVLKKAKAIITVSEFSKAEISEYYKISRDNIFVIHNAVNENFRYTGRIKTGGYILAVSSPAYHKNFHGLIKAFTKSNIKTKLKIIGEASGNFQATERSNIDSRVEFLGRVDDKSLIELYQNADLFVFPSFYEGFGIPPLEAQSCGCPVVSSSRASLPEVLEKSVIYFNPENEDEIIYAITKVLENSDTADELTERGLRNVKRFSWQKSATDLIKAIMLVNKNSINS